MAKPIFIVVAPKGTTQNESNNMLEGLKHKMEDYHCFVLAGQKDEFEFKTFFEKDFDEVKYEELKGIVKELSRKK